MANHHLEFSEVLPLLTDPEIEWLQQQLEIVRVFDGKEYGEGDVSESLDITDAQWTGCRAYRDMPNYDADYGDDAGFAFEFVLNEPESEWGRYLWVYAEESACLDRLGHLVQKFLREFRPQECWSVTYATVCSKPRVGEFGGGAMFITAERIYQEDSYDFVERKWTRFDGRRMLAAE